ncbi:MAG: ABC transporter permease [Deltaproteobacteria bacterium]|nr:MAG: ABC transporter permease [Deltaproteobacteria bacterium]
MNSLRYGWRNLWRNTRRTLITLTAVTLSTAILITSYALMDGLLVHAVSSATNLVVGEVQIHAPRYLADRSIYRALADPARILRGAREKKIRAAPRRYGYGLVAVGTKSAGALFWGVDPELERTTFDLAGHMAKGQFLAEMPSRGMILGRKLARSLQAEVGSEIVVVVQAADGSLGNELFTVTGIFKAAGDAIDRNAALIHAADFTELFVSGDRIHEIALNSRGQMSTQDLATLAADLASKEEVKTWQQLLPAVSDMVNLFDVFIWIFGLIFILAAGMGVMNTMLMATYERIPEFGIIKALGATPWRIIRDVATEALALAALATLLGTALGLAGSYYLQEVGLDTSLFAGSYSVGGVAFDPIWRAAIGLKVVLVPVVLMVIISLVASLYPAGLAARLDPVKAIHRP